MILVRTNQICSLIKEARKVASRKDREVRALNLLTDLSHHIIVYDRLIGDAALLYVLTSEVRYLEAQATYERELNRYVHRALKRAQKEEGWLKDRVKLRAEQQTELRKRLDNGWDDEE